MGQGEDPDPQQRLPEAGARGEPQRALPRPEGLGHRDGVLPPHLGAEDHLPRQAGGVRLPLQPDAAVEDPQPHRAEARAGAQAEALPAVAKWKYCRRRKW